MLDVLPKLVTTVTVPPAVQDELTAGRKLGLNLPDLNSLDWVIVRRPSSSAALPMVTDLGAGEREVLALALETPDSFVFLMMLWLARLPVPCSFASLGHWES